jgi:hypothetical protein
MWTVFPCANHPCGQLPLIFGFFQIPFRMQAHHRASNEPLNSIFGDTKTTRRRRRLDGSPNPPKPPPSATNPGFAEDGCYRHPKQGPNLHLRRPYKPLAEDGRYRLPKQTPSLRHRRHHPPLAENGSSAHQKWTPNLHHRRQIKKSPKTDVTDPQNRVLTSVFGDSSMSQAVRITRPSHAAPT